MLDKRPGSRYEFSAVLPVVLAGIDRYEVFTNQIFQLGLIVEEGSCPTPTGEPQAVLFILQV